MTAIVNGNGTYYRDGAERLYLHVNKSEGHSLPFRDGERVAITFVVGGIEYTGALGARSDYPYIYVATELHDADGTAHKLTHVLRDNGLSKGDRVQLSVAGSRITVA